jgi:hypothetical protein
MKKTYIIRCSYKRTGLFTDPRGDHSLRNTPILRAKRICNLHVSVIFAEPFLVLKLSLVFEPAGNVYQKTRFKKGKRKLQERPTFPAFYISKI